MKKREGERSSQPKGISEGDTVSNIEEPSSNEYQFSLGNRDTENEGQNEEGRHLEIEMLIDHSKELRRFARARVSKLLEHLMRGGFLLEKQ